MKNNTEYSIITMHLKPAGCLYFKPCNLLKTFIFSTIQSGYVCQLFKKHCVEEVGLGVLTGLFEMAASKLKVKIR